MQAPRESFVANLNKQPFLFFINKLMTGLKNMFMNYLVNIWINGMMNWRMKGLLNKSIEKYPNE